MANADSRPIESFRDAEVHAREWMRHFGCRDAEVTQQGTDRGVDVTSSSAVAQVQFWCAKKVGRPVIQMLEGAARGKPALFFSSSGYSQPAIEWANQASIALFMFDDSGNVKPLKEWRFKSSRPHPCIGAGSIEERCRRRAIHSRSCPPSC